MQAVEIGPGSLRSTKVLPTANFGPFPEKELMRVKNNSWFVQYFTVR
jgi:hypothetical protein